MIRGHLLSAPSSLPLVVVDKLGVLTLHRSLKLPYDAKLVHGWCSRRESRNPLLDAALTANFRGLVLGGGGGGGGRPAVSKPNFARKYALELGSV